MLAILPLGSAYVTGTVEISTHAGHKVASRLVASRHCRRELPHSQYRRELQVQRHYRREFLSTEGELDLLPHIAESYGLVRCQFCGFAISKVFEARHCHSPSPKELLCREPE
jgi:hypothetical protein